MDGEEFRRRMSANDDRVFNDLMPVLEKLVKGACASLRVYEKHRQDDVLQEVATKVFTRWASYRGDSRFTTWLYTIARNACLDDIERGSRYVPEPAGENKDGQGFFSAIADESQSDFEQRLCVHQVLAALEAEPDARENSMRKIEVLKWWVEKSPTTEELAAFLKTTHSAATTRKSAIVKAVRALCERYCGHDECAFVNGR